MVTSHPSSPTSHFSLAGNFSPDDIQELLGAMAEEQQHHHHQQQQQRRGSQRAEGEGEVLLASVRNAAQITTTHDESHATAAADGGTTSTLSLTGTDFSEDNIPEESKACARSERKRSREKQRRTDVNKQFSDLTACIKRIEQEESEEDASIARIAFSPTNRVDLIARAIVHLDRLSSLYKRHKSEVTDLQEQLDQAKKAGEDTAAKLKEIMFNSHSNGGHFMPPPPTKQVMMMVPMMVSADGTQTPLSGTAAPGAASMGGNNIMMMMPQNYQQQQHHQQHIQNPFMMMQPQPYMMPQMPNVPNAYATGPGSSANNNNNSATTNTEQKKIQGTGGMQDSQQEPLDTHQPQQQQRPSSAASQEGSQESQAQPHVQQHMNQMGISFAAAPQYMPYNFPNAPPGIATASTMASPYFQPQQHMQHMQHSQNQNYLQQPQYTQQGSHAPLHHQNSNTVTQNAVQHMQPQQLLPSQQQHHQQPHHLQMQQTQNEGHTLSRENSASSMGEESKSNNGSNSAQRGSNLAHCA